ncbi:hypothetical protein [Pseudomonas putida]|uniref:Uncharacterized protein n=1 Tax=Pseudomonas putida TaxID=303 RepID=A0A8I1EBF4_PSEPU|nr:hypothetical protein [Pseudomonas putida]MBI6882416.1 hypothetical protein [Pseudomonas putida]
MNLTDKEIQIINDRRQKIANEARNERLKRRALQVAYRYGCWLARNRSGSSFGTFVNSFGYQKSDSGEMFEVVEQILSAASQAYSSKPAPYEKIIKQ